MSRYRNDLDEERDYYNRGDRSTREGYGEAYYRSRRIPEDRRSEYNRGRFGERADYDYDEPRYSGFERPRNFRDEGYSSSFERGEHMRRGFREHRERSRLRCHEIMTRDLAVATRDTGLTEVAMMMKEEDTGVIPVVDYDVPEGNGRSEERNFDNRSYNRGRPVGLITDRDIVIRCVAEKKDPGATRAEEIMSTDLVSAKPNERVVDVIRKMGDKQVRRIPVVSDSGRLLGMISMADIATETEDDVELAQALEEISRESSFWKRVFK